MIWVVFRAIQWAAFFFAATVAVRLASALVGVCRPDAARESRRRDGRWLFGWLVLLAVSLALVHCQLGGYYSFAEPNGGAWDFDGHGWPLTDPHTLVDRLGASASDEAIYWIAVAVDLLFSLMLLAATRLVVDRWISAWDAPARWPRVRSEAAGWCAALLVVVLCERVADRSHTVPGTNLIVYSTLLHEPPEVHAGMLIGLASIALLIGIRVLHAARMLKRWRKEGVI
jgi:hypothetical protein